MIDLGLRSRSRRNNLLETKIEEIKVGTILEIQEIMTRPLLS